MESFYFYFFIFFTLPSRTPKFYAHAPTKTFAKISKFVLLWGSLTFYSSHNHVELPLYMVYCVHFILHMSIINLIVLHPTTTLHILTICQDLLYCHTSCLVQPPLVTPCPSPSGMVGLAKITQIASMFHFHLSHNLNWDSPIKGLSNGP